MAKKITRPSKAVARGAISPEAVQKLTKLARSGRTEQRVVRRAEMVLRVATGLSEREVARQLDVHRHTVGLWRRRFEELGVDGLTKDRPGRGRKPRAGTERSS